MTEDQTYCMTCVRADTANKSCIVPGSVERTCAKCEAKVLLSPQGRATCERYMADTGETLVCLCDVCAGSANVKCLTIVVISHEVREHLRLDDMPPHLVRTYMWERTKERQQPTITPRQLLALFANPNWLKDVKCAGTQ